MHVWLLQPTPHRRTIFLTRHEPGKGAQPGERPLAMALTVTGDRCALSLVEAARLDWKGMRRLTSPHGRAYGCLGLLRIQDDIFVAVVSDAARVGHLRREHAIYRVRNISFFCVNRATWDMDVSFVEEASELVPGPSVPVTEHPCAAIRKYLQSGSFYFSNSPEFDITARVQRTAEASGAAPAYELRFQSRFSWNGYMIQPMIDYRSRLSPEHRELFDQQGYLLLLMQGYVGIAELPPVPGEPRSTLAVVSRLSSRKAGTRFNARGLDDEGNAANFVETETLLTCGDTVLSFVQVRGSVPVFWEQQGLQALNARIQVTRSQAASQPAFNRHMEHLLEEYGPVFALDLLGTRDAEEALSHAYVQHVDSFVRTWREEADEAGEQMPVRYFHFDFHTTARMAGGIEGVRPEFDRLVNVQTARQRQGVTFAQGTGGAALETGTLRPLEVQTGVFRVNCLDCLDRTNVVQGFLSHAALAALLRGSEGVPAELASVLAPLQSSAAVREQLWSTHYRLWAENGDALSRISTGTGSLNSGFLRGGKKTITGLLSDAAKSANRLYNNNFQDRSKQEAIDLLLGNHSGQQPVQLFDPLYDEVDRQLAQRTDEYATRKSVRMLLGTYNVSAQSAPINPAALDPWLRAVEGADPELVTLSFQEIVPLTAQQMLSSAAEPAHAWERAVLSALNRGAAPGEEYVQLRHDVQFGTSTLVLAKQRMLHHIRSIEGSTTKTGFRGMSGNKGGVAVRMDVFNTGVCVVGAHLAAGSSNVEERNSDYASIASGTLFPRGRRLQSHEHVFWLGDFNYRIDALAPEAVRSLAEQASGSGAAAQDALRRLYEHDQLAQARSRGLAFAGYKEPPITFAPTYKYDVGTSQFDTSEKLRPPAWTDRILYRHNALRGAHALRLVPETYARAELMLSDHRPVYGTFVLDVLDVDEERRAAIRQEILAGTLRDSAVPVPEPGVPELPAALAPAELPAPSSDAYQWWNEGGPLSPACARGSCARGNPFTASAAPNATGAPPARRTAPQPPGRTPGTGTRPAVRTDRVERRAPPPIPARKPTQEEAPDGAAPDGTAPGAASSAADAPPALPARAT